MRHISGRRRMRVLVAHTRTRTRTRRIPLLALCTRVRPTCPHCIRCCGIIMTIVMITIIRMAPVLVGLVIRALTRRASMVRRRLRACRRCRRSLSVGTAILTLGA